MTSRLRSRRSLALLGTAVFWCSAAPLLDAADQRPEPVEFNSQVRPILSDACFPCHGPDAAKRKANLRLDTENGAFAERDGRRAIVARDLGNSELYARITAADPAERMPPVSTGRVLTPEQVDVIRRWIEQGAPWQKHWSLIPPRRPPLPVARDHAWSLNPVDRFIRARLEREGLAPSPEADRTTLIRRVTLDLTGLPPTPAEVDAFLADRSPGAYERVVDRLLASPRYGERMAVRWLDAARYADTNGYQTDGERFMWRWRDWVIDAFNHNMPFDRFTIEQLAGDLLPNPTLDQRIATGFNRNHRGNAEGGIVPEEYAVEYVVDRVDTTATVWLGMTMGCARCHDHKFDPVTQKEFYQAFAFFNNVPERGKAIKYGNSPPVLKAPTRAQQEKLAQIHRALEGAEREFAALRPAIDLAQARWEKNAGNASDWAPSRGLVAHYALDGGLSNSVEPSSSVRFVDGRPGFVPGRLKSAAELDGRGFIDAGDVAGFGFYDQFTISAWVKPAPGAQGTIVSRMTDAPQGDGYYVTLESGTVRVNLVKRWLDDAIRLESERTLPPNEWHHVAVSYDGSREARGVTLAIDGKPERLKIILDDLNQSFQTKEPLRIGAGGGPGSRFRGAIDDVRIFRVSLTPQELAIVATPESIAEVLAVPKGRRTAAQSAKLAACFLEEHAPDAIRAAARRCEALRQERDQFLENVPTTMVMEELPIPRTAFVLKRGEYDKRGEPVTPGVPASLAPWSGKLPRNRLGFARWLLNAENPLTARVAVNRYWQMYFGTGLVKTVDDFGSQGEWPRHPELLDWLATEFVRIGWDVKAMQRLIVTSATYRQSSHASRELLKRDPENRLHARGPRVRLSAEMIRDQALAASGLLVERLGGPSVKPYQPPGLWKELTEVDYQPDTGANLYRRSLYTFWKRTVAPPSMMTFDAAGRETCVVRESRTNTPLQALTLLNDVTFVEAARMLGQRAMIEGGSNPEDRLVLAFRLATGRPPSAAERAILLDDLHAHLARYRRDPEAARRLIAAGESKARPDLDPGELAAYTAVSSLILNLDETITKE
jgi:hypothetical protein